MLFLLVLGTSTFSKRDEASLYSFFCVFYLNLFLDLLKLLHIAFTLIFWTCTLKKRPFLWFCSWFYTIRSLYYSEFCISLRISRFLEEQSRHFLLYAEDPANLQLVYHFYTTQYHLESFTKTLQFHPQIRPFYAERLLSPCDFTKYYSITLSLAILAYPVLRQKHTSLPISRRRHQKNRESTLYFARELNCYTICYPHFLSGKTRLTWPQIPLLVSLPLVGSNSIRKTGVFYAIIDKVPRTISRFRNIAKQESFVSKHRSIRVI